MSLNGDKMLEKMSDVDESLIVGTDEAGRSKKLFLKAGIITAAAAAAVAVGLNLIPRQIDSGLPELPKIAVSENILPGGMGFEGLSASLVEKEKTNLLGQNFKIREMPVYKTYSANPDIDKIKSKFREIADYFNLDYDNLDITEDITDEETLRAQFEENGASEEEIESFLKISRMNTHISSRLRDDNGKSLISISINAVMGIDISFSVPENDDEKYFGTVLPSEYRFGDDSTPEELEAAGRYLLDKYADIIDMKNPEVLSDPDYDGYVTFYERGENDAESIANQSIKTVSFGGSNNRVDIIRINDGYKCCEKIEDYPIITVDKAAELLQSGNYLTSVPYDLKGDEEIGFVELIYRFGIGYETAMPFYRFLVLIPEEEFQRDERIYGGYYVPAVREEYLENMPQPAISFNGGLIKK